VAAAAAAEAEVAAAVEAVAGVAAAAEVAAGADAAAGGAAVVASDTAAVGASLEAYCLGACWVATAVVAMVTAMAAVAAMAAMAMVFTRIRRAAVLLGAKRISAPTTRRPGRILAMTGGTIPARNAEPSASSLWGLA
jgi:hypothetical protein